MCPADMTKMSNEVRAEFDAAPPDARQGMLALRALILAEADRMPDIGALTEALRWGQPAYLTLASGAGSTLRVGLPKSGGFALFAHCQTSLIADFKALVGAECRVEGNRAVLFRTMGDLRPDLLGLLIRRALRWHWRQ